MFRLLIDGFMVETGVDAWACGRGVRRRAVESEVMRAVPSVKGQFTTFVEEVLPHKPKKNADCTGAEAVHEKVSRFKLFLDGDRGKREREIAPLVEEMKAVERGKAFDLGKLEAKVQAIAAARKQRQKENYWAVC